MRLPVDKYRRLEVQRLAGDILNESLSAFQNPSRSAPGSEHGSLVSASENAFVAATKFALSSAQRRTTPTAVEKEGGEQTNPASSSESALSWRQQWRSLWKRHSELKSQIDKNSAAPQALSDLNKEL